MRILWPHNFDPADPFSGTFMYASAEALALHGVSIEMLYLGNLRRPNGIVAARRLIARKSSDYDITHAQFGSACALASAGSHSRVRIVSLRGSDWTPAFSTRPLLRIHGRLARLFTLYALPRFDVILTMSHRVRTELHSHNPSARVEYVPDPVDTTLFHPHDRAQARATLGLDPHTKYVAFTSVNSENELKRPRLAREAVELAQQVDSSIELLPLTRIPHAHMPLYFSAANAALSTSTSEGWPNCIKEALACGIPFVSTDVSDLGMIAERHASCVIAEPTAEALAQGILDTLAREADTFALRGEVHHMSLDSAGAALAGLYRHLLSGDRTLDS